MCRRQTDREYEMRCDAMRMDFSDIKFNNPIEWNCVQKSVFIKCLEHNPLKLSVSMTFLGIVCAAIRDTLKENGIYYIGLSFNLTLIARMIF